MLGLLAVLTMLAGSPASAQEVRTATDVLHELVIRKAKEAAAKDYVEPANTVDPKVANMTYQEYRAIRFIPDKAIWRGESLFEIQLFHTGFLYKQPVQINLANEAGQQQRVPFDKTMFRYDGDAARFADMMTDTAGFAGFRVHYPLNTENYYDEFVVFQGATYFRMVGPGQIYGLSARGLAVNTAEPEGEEFPVFNEFWLFKPAPEDTHLIAFALMDSPSITGAFRFVLNPGAPTIIDVDARLFTRKPVKKLGIAPLTSMFHYGENRTRFVDDFRPEVHDSDGLLMRTSHDEWIWRPLSNPKTLQVSSLQDVNPKGFGLLQRDRNFNNYLDAEALYSERPSIWVEPVGDWGEGRVELVEIPTKSETHDNIAAYWVPKETIEAGQEFHYSYRLRSFNASLPEHNIAQVHRTRIGWSALPGEDNAPPASERQFIVDFKGGELDTLSAELELHANLQITNGDHKDLMVMQLPDEKTWRVSFKLAPKGNESVDMRLYVAWRDQRLTEVWNYVWHPDGL